MYLCYFMCGSNSGLLYPQGRVEKGGILYCRCCIGVSISDGRRRVFGSQVLTTLLFNTSVNSCGMTCDCRCVTRTVAAIYHSYVLLLLSIIIHFITHARAFRPQMPSVGCISCKDTYGTQTALFLNSLCEELVCSLLGRPLLNFI